MKQLVFLLPLILLGALPAAEAVATHPSPPSASVTDNPGAPAAVDGFYLVTEEPAQVSRVFRADISDKTFENAANRWAKLAGWSISWELGTEYSIGFSADFGTDFIKALDGLCASLNSSGIRARSRVYMENKVVRIVLEGAN